jgi:hypothetical protein
MRYASAICSKDQMLFKIPATNAKKHIAIVEDSSPPYLYTRYAFFLVPSQRHKASIARTNVGLLRMDRRGGLRELTDV